MTVASKTTVQAADTAPLAGDRSTPVAELAAVFGVLLAIAVAATYPLVLHLTTHLPNDLGDPVLVTTILGWDAKAIAHGFTNVWNAPTFFPYERTLVFSEHLLGIAIFTAPLQWLSGNAILVYNIAFLASFAQAGLGMYLLARLLTGRRDAALLAALIYAFTPQRVAQLAHLQWLVIGWLPIALWALHRYVRTGRSSALLIAAAAYVVQSLSSSYLTYFALVPLVIVGVTGLWRARPPAMRTALQLAAASALVLAVLAPVATAYYQVRQEHEFQRSPTEIESMSADVRDYFVAHANVHLWTRVGAASGEHELFPGGVAIALAAIALISRRTRSSYAVRVYAAIAITAFLLSLGPHPRAWEHRLPFAGPYQLLLDVVPGLDGLRAVARFGVVVLLAVTVLAAIGASALQQWVSPRRQWLVTGLLALAIVAEGWAAPIHTPRFEPTGDPGERDAYEFVRQSGPGAVLELPSSQSDDPARELRYQYLTLVHGHPIMNGLSGYDPGLLRFFGGSGESPLNDPALVGDALDFVRGLGVRYVLVHPEQFHPPELEAALARELGADRGRVESRRQFGRTMVYTLRRDDVPPIDPAANAWRLIPAAEIRADASNAPNRLPLLFDGDRDSRWLTQWPQTGIEWVEAAFATPRDVALVRMQMAERSFGDYPRELVIEAVEDSGSREVFRGSVLPFFGRGVRANHSYPTIDVPLPPNHARAIRLRQLGKTTVLYWSIHELQLWERGGPRQ